MKKSIAFLMVCMVIMLAVVPVMSFAFDVDSIVNDVKSQDAADISMLTEAGGTIYATIQTAGIVIALIVVVVFGVQWLVATPAKKAELKGKMWNIVIGIAIILLASALISQVGQMIESMDGGTSSSSGGAANPD